ncbi:hypothetical protein J6590_025072, partial [Homalodisca vitripennis]
FSLDRTSVQSSMPPGIREDRIGSPHSAASLTFKCPLPVPPPRRAATALVFCRLADLEQLPAATYSPHSNGQSLFRCNLPALPGRRLTHHLSQLNWLLLITQFLSGTKDQKFKTPNGSEKREYL